MNAFFFRVSASPFRSTAWCGGARGAGRMEFQNKAAFGLTCASALRTCRWRLRGRSPVWRSRIRRRRPQRKADHSTKLLTARTKRERHCKHHGRYLNSDTALFPEIVNHLRFGYGFGTHVTKLYEVFLTMRNMIFCGLGREEQK